MNKLKLLSKSFAIITGLLIFIFVLNYTGFLNFYYKNRFKKVSSQIEAEFENYLNEIDSLTKNIASDPIIRGAILQYKLGENILPAVQTLNLYKANYKIIKNVTLLDFDRKIIITDFSLIQPAELEQDWIKISVNKKLYFTPVYFKRQINSYIISTILPLLNILDEIEGFIKIDFSLDDFLSKIEKFKGINFVIIDNNSKINFVYPLDSKISINEKDIINLKFTSDEYLNDLARIKKINQAEFLLLTLAKEDFKALPLYLKFILIFSILICILSYAYLLIDKKLKVSLERNKKIKNVIDEIVKESQKSSKKYIEIIESPTSYDKELPGNEKKTEQQNDKISPKIDDFKII